jgi:malyl-CoA/(S)-citramalyl-CoA lyase
VNKPPRCILSVPVNRPAFLGKAAKSSADTIMLDLEDSIFPDQKPQARLDAVLALREQDWGSKQVLVRVNGLSTEWGSEDLSQIAATSPRLNGFMVPKVESRADVERLFEILGRDPSGRKLGVHFLVETALGVSNVESILAAAPRPTSVTFGSGDYAWSVSDWSGLGRQSPAGGRPLLDWAKARVVNACYAYGVTPIDGPSADIKDNRACADDASAARRLGFAGKWAIHPEQIPFVLEAFAPSPEAVTWARAVLSSLEEAHRAGTGSAQFNGQLIEAAHQAVAKRIIGNATLQDDER